MAMAAASVDCCEPSLWLRPVTDVAVKVLFAQGYDWEQGGE